MNLPGKRYGSGLRAILPALFLLVIWLTVFERREVEIELSAEHLIPSATRFQVELDERPEPVKVKPLTFEPLEVHSVRINGIELGMTREMANQASELFHRDHPVAEDRVHIGFGLDDTVVSVSGNSLWVDGTWVRVGDHNKVLRPALGPPGYLRHSPCGWPYEVETYHYLTHGGVVTVTFFKDRWPEGINSDVPARFRSQIISFSLRSGDQLQGRSGSSLLRTQERDSQRR